MCAYTGVAASLLTGGVTAHRLFGLPVEEQGNAAGSQPMTSTLGSCSLAASVLRESRTIIIDEAGMLHSRLVDCIDLTLRDICDSPFPFAGKNIIFAGDFQQVPPVVP